VKIVDCLGLAVGLSSVACTSSFAGLLSELILGDILQEICRADP